jgi:tetratricopeptide (TPR) repeat protein
MSSSTRNQDVVGPGLRKLLIAVLVLFAMLIVDSVYLATVTFLEWFQDVELQSVVYQSAFLVHLALGFLITVPALVFAIIHLRRAIGRPNPIAVRLGLMLFATVLLLLVSGILLTRGLPVLEVRHPETRSLLYWLHIAAPLAACWLFVLHRLAGPKIHWSAGSGILVLSLVLSVSVIWIAEPKQAPAPVGNFVPSLAQTSSGNLIAAEHLMQDEYCASCHADSYDQWQHSAHHLASFNNPAYLFSVRNTRQVALERDGDVRAARFCAGCHDPVPLFSGAFDEADFDDQNHPTAHAGITCVACHAIESLSSARGNSDYVISAPEHYPFAFSDNDFLLWVNGLLIKGKPALHKRTFLKPLHRSAEFCGTCHKVHLPEALNKYKWLRGQNHYDSFLLSGVSGHGVQSFYYPGQAVEKCAGCHMPLTPSDDLAAAPNGGGDALTIHSHHFPAANTALPHLLGLPEEVNDRHRQMLEGALRVDIFALRQGSDIDAPLIAPLRPQTPALIPGESYVFDVVIRSLRIGHLFTEGTADSNEVWLEVTVEDDLGVIGQSGKIHPDDGEVDPWSHFVNAYVLDRQGNRIDRRNAEDIFTKLYDHQIPPGAADAVHYSLRLPETSVGPVRITASLKYRKFDTTYLRLFQGDEFDGNDLPIITIATDTVTLGGESGVSPVLEWERWNDYGIGLLRKGGRGELRQAEAAFKAVSGLNRAEGALNTARVYIREGRLDEAVDALTRAAAEGAYPWSVAWFSGVVDMQNGELDAAIERFNSLVETRFTEAQARGFDFSLDYRLQNQLAQALFERSKLARDKADENAWLDKSAQHFSRTLEIDPENVPAHYGLSQLYARLGDAEKADYHRAQHEIYRLDDNAHDRAVANARRQNPAANHASDAVVIYDLQRDPATIELSSELSEGTSAGL